jgi:hypothetical protein
MRKLSMNRVILAGALALALPAAAPAGGGDRVNGAKECRYERGSTAATREAFAAEYRTFGHCVSAKARDEAAEHKSAKSTAARTCKAERGTTSESRKAFEAKYGTNGKKANAMGKCVSAAAKAREDEADAADRAAADKRKQAAKRCARERTDSRTAFAAKYRTFGKCVSMH